MIEKIYKIKVIPPPKITLSMQSEPVYENVANEIYATVSPPMQNVQIQVTIGTLPLPIICTAKNGRAAVSWTFKDTGTYTINACAYGSKATMSVIVKPPPS